MTTFNRFFSIFISPLRFSLLAHYVPGTWRMTRRQNSGSAVSGPSPHWLSPPPPLPLGFSLLSPQLSRLPLQISFCCLATAPQAMSHRIAYYSFREINRREKILAVTLELLCTNVPKPGNPRGDIIVEFCTMVPRSSLTHGVERRVRGENKKRIFRWLLASNVLNISILLM